jgi:hypothetical protein
MDSENKGPELVRKYPAPYVPFSTFETALDKLGALPTLPPRIDHTVFPSMGGVAKGQVIGTLKFFKLIDNDGIPDPQLKELAKNKEHRKTAMRELLTKHYPNISENDLAGASPGQLDSKLSDKTYNISGETKQKARSFLIKAAEFAGLPISTLLKAKGPRGPRPRRARNVPRQNNNGAQAQNNGQPADEPARDPKVIRMPIPLAPGRIAYVELPEDWTQEKDAKKLLSLLGLTFDVNVQVS